MKKSSRKPIPAHQVSVGLDLGLETGTACFLSREGEVLSVKTIAMTPADLAAAFEQVERTSIVIEASPIAGWVSRVLTECGHDVMTCNPRRLRLIAESSLKTDRLDAETLARLARLGQLDERLIQAITVRSRQTQLNRSRLAVRDQLIGMRTQFINVVKSVLVSDAIKPPKCDAERLARKTESMALPDDIRKAIQPMLDVLHGLEEQISKVDAELDELGKQMPITQVFREIDGVGRLTSLAFALTIEDPARFEHVRHVGAYLGMTPSVRQSSTIERRGRITKAGDGRLRRYLVQAAISLLRSRHDSALKRWGLALRERCGPKKARVAVARKLAVVMLTMWKDGTCYQPFPSASEVHCKV